MKVPYKFIGNVSRSKVLRAFVFFLAVSLLSLSPVFAQDSTAVAPDSAAATVVDDGSGPSIANLTKNMAASAEELERIRRDEILSYVYMGLGFSVVIGIAWFTTVLAKKRRKKEDEMRAIRAQNMKHHQHGKAHHRR